MPSESGDWHGAQAVFRGAVKSLYLDLGGGYRTHVKMFLVIYLRFVPFPNVSNTSIKKRMQVNESGCPTHHW